jgi:hypothetical protein
MKAKPRHPSAQPRATRVPRLHDATPAAPDAKAPNAGAAHRSPRILRGKNFRLRNVHPD